MNFEKRICIIGAGPSGITAAKNCILAGFKNIVVYESNSEVGGNWVYSPKLSHSSVCATTHIISSKKLSEYLDFPMPSDYPDYPSHTQMKNYFQSYAQHFGLYPFIQFNTTVKHANLEEGKWKIELANDESQYFDYLMVANGHHWNPRMPEYPGNFSGEIIHSHYYKNNEPFQNKKVLVIGGGNSACDCAVETSRVSTKTAISMRRGYYIIPKYLFGKPTDLVNLPFKKLPKWIKIPLMKIALKLNIGNMQDYGLQKPDSQLLSTHPTLNSELFYMLGHGKVLPRVDIEKFDNNMVFFKDGKAEEYDVIIAATGYKITFPFFDTSFINYTDKEVPLYLRVFNPQHHNLFFIGLFQPLGCIWPLADLQSRIVCNYLKGTWQLPVNLNAKIEAEVNYIKKQFDNTPRHSIEVDYHEYLNLLEKELG